MADDRQGEYPGNPIVRMADQHLDETLERLDKSLAPIWEGQAEYGRNVTTLSSAAIVASVSLAQFLIGRGVTTHWTILLPIAWVLFALALILGATHHAFLGYARMFRLRFEMKRGQMRSEVAALDSNAAEFSDKFD